MMTAVSSIRKQSVGVVAWRARLGTALSSELEFLRDKREEREIQTMAQREVDHRLGVREREQEQERDRHWKNDKKTNYSLREEQEALWFRTASTD